MRTHCKRGHELSGSNLRVYVTKAGYSQRQCLTCKKRADRAHYEANADALKAYSRQWSKDNRERARARSRKWAEENRDLIREKRQQHMEDPAFRERNKEWQKTYREKHKEAIAARTSDKYHNDPDRRARILDRSKVYYQKNKDRHIAWGREYRTRPEVKARERELREKNKAHDQQYHRARYEELKTKQPEKFREQSKRANRKSRERLTDAYVISVIQATGIPRAKIKAMPELVAAKRVQIKLRRTAEQLLNKSTNEAHS